MTDPKPLPHPNVRMMFGADGKPTQAAYEFLERLVKVVKDANSAISTLQGTTHPPLAAQYVVVANDATLTADRKLTAGTGITVTDGGANGNVTIACTVTAGGITIVAEQSAGVGIGTTFTTTGIPSNKALAVYLNSISHNGTGGATQALRVEVSSNGGTNWSSPITVSPVLADTVLTSGVIHIGTDGGGEAFIATGAIGALGGKVAIGGGGNVIDAIRLSWSLGGSFDASGTVLTHALN